MSKRMASPLGNWEKTSLIKKKPTRNSNFSRLGSNYVFNECVRCLDNGGEWSSRFSEVTVAQTS